MSLGAEDSSAPVCLAPPARPATRGFRVPRERASAASLALQDLRDPLALATRDARGLLGPLDPQGPQDRLPFLAPTGRPSVFLARQAPLGPQAPLDPWVLLQG